MKTRKHLRLVAGDHDDNPKAPTAPSPSSSGLVAPGSSPPQNFDQLVDEWSARLDRAEANLDAMVRRIRGL